MINGSKTREEWQRLVNAFNPEKQSKRDYCKEKHIKYNAFRNWYFRLKSNSRLTKREGVESKLSVSDVPEEVVNKEFIGFKLVPSITKIKLPNGITIEVVSGNITELIKELYHVA